jgi:hypothetical protein
MKLPIDFDLLASDPKRALRRVLSFFARLAVEIVDVSSDGRTRRTAGVSYREVSLVFADSQRIALRVKATGDIYEARLNGKVQPMGEQDDPAKAVAELAGLLDRNRGRFQKRMAALAMKPPEGAKTAAPKLRQSLEQQIAQVDAEIDAAEAELASLT